MSEHITRTDLGAAFAQWERAFNSSPVVVTRVRRGITGLRIVARAGGQGGAGGNAGAPNVPRQINALIKRTPQVLVRISGGGRSVSHVKAHLDYIARHGRIDLEDQDGARYAGKDDLDALRDEWRYGGFPMADGTERAPRQAFNIVLSMPAGTDAAALLRAARAFAHTEFPDHQYVMALHTHDTDPHDAPAVNPHVHLCVKATALTGIRLNPRKADLQRWREHFAHCLREQGIEADASSRLQRLQRKRGEKQSVRHLKARGEALHSIGKSTASPAQVEKARRLEAAAIASQQAVARTLAHSDLPRERVLARLLVQRLTGRDGGSEGRDVERR